MPQISLLLNRIEPSATKEATRRAAELRNQGHDIIILTQGELDFDTPDYICETAIAAIRAGHTRYTPVAGEGALREAIKEKLYRDSKLDYSIEEITVGCGAKQVLFNAFMAGINPGDEVLIPTPCWVTYPEVVRMVGGVPILVPCTGLNGYKMTADQLASHLTSRTRWVVLNSPNNPTGAVYSDQELSALADIIDCYSNLWVLCDEVYEKLVYTPNRFASLPTVAPQLKERILLVNGVSKSSAMTGWRVGYGAGPPTLIQAMNTIQGQTTSHTCSIAQHAAIAALQPEPNCTEYFRKELLHRRNAVVERIRTIPGLAVQLPQGAFYLFVDCTELIGCPTRKGRFLDNDRAIAGFLLESAGVAVVPGEAFLASPFFRLSFASPLERLMEACDRIETACGNLING